jgi:glycosyltransferase involved in cell wall biosynthesis
LGFVNERRKINELKKAKIFCSLSSIEGFGISLLEAFACKTTVIVRDLPCYHDFTSNNCAIFLNDTEANDPKFVANIIIKLLANENLLKVYTENAYKLVKYYDWDKITRLVEKVYEMVIDRDGVYEIY